MHWYPQAEKDLIDLTLKLWLRKRVHLDTRRIQTHRCPGQNNLAFIQLQAQHPELQALWDTRRAEKINTQTRISNAAPNCANPCARAPAGCFSFATNRRLKPASTSPWPVKPTSSTSFGVEKTSTRAGLPDGCRPLQRHPDTGALGGPRLHLSLEHYHHICGFWRRYEHFIHDMAVAGTDYP